MRTEKEIRKRLDELQQIARQLNPQSKYNPVPLVDIKQESLRAEIHTLLWTLDIVG